MTGNTPTTGRAPASISDLLEMFGERWQMAYQGELNVWSAERRSPDGRHRQFLAAHDPATLAGRIRDAETADR